jgi:hypothetical protein
MEPEGLILPVLDGDLHDYELEERSRPSGGFLMQWLLPRSLFDSPEP